MGMYYYSHKTFFRNCLISALRFFEASLRILIEFHSLLFPLFDVEQLGQLSRVGTQSLIRRQNFDIKGFRHRFMFLKCFAGFLDTSLLHIFRSSGTFGSCRFGSPHKLIDFKKPSS